MKCEGDYCQEQADEPAEATTTNVYGEPRCASCETRENEAAHERVLDDFCGGEGVQTLKERMDDAYKQKYGR